MEITSRPVVPPPPPDGAILKSKSELLVRTAAGVLVAASALLDRVPSWAGRGSRSPMEAAVAGKEQTDGARSRESGAALFLLPLLLWAPLFLSQLKIGSTSAESM